MRLLQPRTQGILPPRRRRRGGKMPWVRGWRLLMIFQKLETGMAYAVLIVLY